MSLIERPSAHSKLGRIAIRPSFECADGRSIKLMAQTKDNLHVNLWAQDHEAYLTMQATAELN